MINFNSLRACYLVVVIDNRQASANPLVHKVVDLLLQYE